MIVRSFVRDSVLKAFVKVELWHQKIITLPLYSGAGWKQFMCSHHTNTMDTFPYNLYTCRQFGRGKFAIETTFNDDLYIVEPIQQRSSYSLDILICVSQRDRGINIALHCVCPPHCDIYSCVFAECTISQLQNANWKCCGRTCIYLEPAIFVCCVCTSLLKGRCVSLTQCCVVGLLTQCFVDVPQGIFLERCAAGAKLDCELSIPAICMYD